MKRKRDATNSSSISKLGGQPPRKRTKKINGPGSNKRKLIPKSITVFIAYKKQIEWDRGSDWPDPIDHDPDKGKVSFLGTFLNRDDALDAIADDSYTRSEDEDGEHDFDPEGYTYYDQGGDDGELIHGEGDGEGSKYYIFEDSLDLRSLRESSSSSESESE